MTKTETLNRIRREKIIAIVRGVGSRHIAKSANALAVGGVTCIEVTFCPSDEAASRDTLVSIGTLCREFGDRLFFGAGTVLTPEQAVDWGADIVKMFPAGVLGPAYIKAITSSMSHLSMAAVGGVQEDNIAGFLGVGAACFGIGGNLVDVGLVCKGEFATIIERARRFVAAVSQK